MTDLGILILFILVPLIQGLSPLPPEAGLSPLFLASTALGRIGAAILILGLMSREASPSTIPDQTTSPRPAPARSLSLGLATGAGFYLLAPWILGALVRVFGPATNPLMEGVARQASQGPFILALGAGALSAAFFEEVLYRHWLFQALWRHRAASPALLVLASTLVFTLGHLSQGGHALVLVALMGITLGVLRLRTATWIPGFAAHALYNTLVVASQISN